MNADSRELKFTDGLERELIRQEGADRGDSGNGYGFTLEPLLKWFLAVAMAIGSLFAIVQGEL